MEQEVIERPIAWVIADTETPSLKVADGIVEIALREIDPDTLEVIDEVQSLIDCECPIDPFAQQVHGISAEMLIGQPTMQEFIETPGEQFLNGRFDGRDIVMICHNASFDVARLHAIGNIKASICTLFHARQLIPRASATTPDGPGDHKLGTLREYFGFPANAAHRALADVDTTQRLLVEILGRTNRTLRDFLTTMDTTVHRMPWGKHAGKLLIELPRDYLLWLKKECEDLEPNLLKSVDKALKVK